MVRPFLTRLIEASSPPSPPKWLPGSKPRPDWDAPQTTLTEAEEKEIIEDRSNDPEEETAEEEEYNPDVPLIHETYTYVAPPESEFGHERSGHQPQGEAGQSTHHG